MTRGLGFLIWVAAMTLALCAIAGNAERKYNDDSASVRPKEKPTLSGHSASQGRLHTANALVVPAWSASLPAAHRVHAAETKLGCVDCHTNARSSNASKDWLMPAAERCVECHEQRFANVRSAPTLPPRLRFSHQRHAQKGVACEVCHGRVSERDDAYGSERLPLMAVCLRCHGGAKAAKLKAGSDCRLCHFSRGGVIQTRFREGLLVPSNSLGSIEHAGNWLYRHGESAMNQGTLCSGCHKDSECFECHNGSLRPRSIHPSDWLSLHGIEARQEGGNCVSCHRSQSECLTCHLRAGLTQTGPRAVAANRGRFHPPPSIWTDRPRTGRHHAVQARLHMDECVSCHQERDCASCHATAAVGGPGLGAPYSRGLSPHPPGFASHCSGILSKNPRPCFVCHRADDLALHPCR